MGKNYIKYLPKDLLIEILINLDTSDINQFIKCKFIKNGKHLYEDLIKKLCPDIYKVTQCKDLDMLVCSDKIKTKIKYFKFLYTNMNTSNYTSFIFNPNKTITFKSGMTDDIQDEYSFLILSYILGKNIDINNELDKIIRSFRKLRKFTSNDDDTLYKKCSTHINLIYELLNKSQLKLRSDTIFNILVIFSFCPSIKRYISLCESMISSIIKNCDMYKINKVCKKLSKSLSRNNEYFNDIYRKMKHAQLDQKETADILFHYLNYNRTSSIIFVNI